MLNTSSAYMREKSLQSRLTLCNPMDCCPPASSGHAILWASIREWVAVPPPGGLPDPGMETESPAAPTLQADSSMLSYQKTPMLLDITLNYGIFLWLNSMQALKGEP